MLNLLRMDIRRLFRRKMLYVLLIVMSAVMLSMLCLSDPGNLTIASVLGVMDGVSMDNFTSAASGLGLTYTLICIFLSFIVCDDFSTGFAKNIFTVHARKRDYISSKIICTMAASGILMLVSTIEAVGFCVISGIEVGSIGGILIFLAEKWLVSAAFAAAILFISLLSRNKGIGFLFACLLGTGGLVMGIAGGLEAFHIPFVSQITSWTIYGASTKATLSFQAGNLLHMIAATVVWTAVYSFLSRIVLRAKDI